MVHFAAETVGIASSLGFFPVSSSYLDNSNVNIPLEGLRNGIIKREK